MLTVFLSACSRLASPRRVRAGLLLTLVCTLATGAKAAPLPTTTTLTLSSSSVASPTEVTLTASVTGAVTGTVTFCEDAATTTKLCEDAAIVGKAQLVAGAAILRIIPAIGTHSYQAVFSATTAAAASTSLTQTLIVTGLYPTTTTLSATGNPSGYDITATVVGSASQPPVLAGNVTFQDTTDNNLQLGIVPLGIPVLVQSYAAAPGSPVQTGNQPSITGVGDFNEDGIPDLAIENAGDNTISILLGKGDGTFSAPSFLPAVGTPPCQNINVQSNCAIAVGDFNDDGHADLVLTSRVDGTLTLLKGNGQGSFTPFIGSPIVVGTSPQAVKIGDFNNDGIQDLVVANGDDDTITILLGNGDGTFTQAGGSPVTLGGLGPDNAFPFFIAVADFNHDGNADLAVVMGRANTVIFLKGNGDGTFTQFPGSPFTFANSAGSGAIVAAYFNGDLNIDLAVANFNDDNVIILLGNGDGTFTASAQGSDLTVGSNPFAMVALDYDGDGVTDLAVANYDYYDQGPTPPSVTILKGKGDGTFSSPPALAQIPVGQLPTDVVTADFNGDGHPDLAIPDSADTYTTILLDTFTQTATATLNNVVLDGAGIHVVKGTYPATTAFAASSGTIDLEGLGVAPALTLTANPPAQLDTLSVTFTAQLSPIATSVPPTGTISFTDVATGAHLGTVAINAAGQASLATSTLGDGIHIISASYSGDVVYQASNSAQLSITISDLMVSRVGNNDTTILPGTTVVYKLLVQPQVATTFLDNVTMSASGLPAGATATFSSPTLAAGAMTASITMTVDTSKTALNAAPPFPYQRLPLALGLLLPLIGLRRRWRQIPGALGVLALAGLSLMAVVGLNGCAGAGLFAARKVPYPITVTATEGNAGGSIQRFIKVPLAIQ